MATSRPSFTGVLVVLAAVLLGLGSLIDRRTRKR
jgi:hypothetical protein